MGYIDDFLSSDPMCGTRRSTPTSINDFLALESRPQTAYSHNSNQHKGSLRAY